MNKIIWPFDQAPNAAAISSRQVIELKYPILQVVHYAHDNSWAFTCGTTAKSKDLLIILMKNIIKLDPTLSEIAKLEPGYSATRLFVGGKWNIIKDDDDNDE